jgi:hypothetical protein
MPYSSPELGVPGHTVNINIQNSNESLAALPGDTPPEDKLSSTSERVKRALQPRTPKSYY